MSLSLDLATALQPLVGQTYAPSRTVSVQDPARIEVTVSLLAVETVGVRLEELQLTTTQLAGATLQVLQRWAEALCKRVTYLLEGLGPLEYDATTQQVLIRSTPPDTHTPQSPKFYEILLSSLGAGKFVLRRYEADRASGGRVATPLQLTHEQLAKLVNDLVASLPVP